MRKPVAADRLPEPGEAKRGQEGYLGYLLRQAASGYTHRVERALADLAVTPPQFAVMTMLRAYSGHSNADIARLALLTPQTVSVIIANLRRAGAVVRRPHAIHGRIQHLELSEPGLALLLRCRDRVHAIERDLVEGLGLEQEAAIRAWLVRTAVAETTAPSG